MSTESMTSELPSATGAAEPSPLSRAIASIEGESRVDPAVDAVERVATAVASGSRRPWLEGRPMGHALHPAAVIVPLGCWLSATILDLSPRRAPRTSRRLVAIGILAAVPATATGLAEFRTLTEPAQRRVAAVHAIGNVLALGAFATSWWRRLRHRQFAGMLSGLVGTALIAVTGHLGGHLAYVTGAGHGRRDQITESPLG